MCIRYLCCHLYHLSNINYKQQTVRWRTSIYNHSTLHQKTKKSPVNKDILTSYSITCCNSAVRVRNSSTEICLCSEIKHYTENYSSKLYFCTVQTNGIDINHSGFTPCSFPTKSTISSTFLLCAPLVCLVVYLVNNIHIYLYMVRMDATILLLLCTSSLIDVPGYDIFLWRGFLIQITCFPASGVMKQLLLVVRWIINIPIPKEPKLIYISTSSCDDSHYLLLHCHAIGNLIHIMIMQAWVVKGRLRACMHQRGWMKKNYKRSHSR